MVEFITMTAAVREDLLQQLAARTDDPELEARRQHILRVFLDARPEVKQGLVQEALAHALRPLVHQFERRLGRTLTAAERARLAERVRSDGSEQVGDVVLDLTREQLAVWLASAGEDR
jgi:hypothetical protein